MSNDTRVHLVIRSNDPLELLAALAYLRNKDKTCGLSCEDVKYEEDIGYFFRLEGEANENFNYYHVTGSEGEIADLLTKFPSLETSGYYTDEHGAGELYGAEKSGGEKDEDSKFCLNLNIPSLYKAKGWDGHSCEELSEFVFDYLSLLPFGHGGGSYSCSEGASDPAQVSFHADLFGESKADLIENGLAYLRKLGAPKDTFLQEENYFTAKIPKEELVWGEDSLPAERIRAEEVTGFLNELLRKSELKPTEEDLKTLLRLDLEWRDSEGNNVLHLAAKAGQLNLVNPEMLTAENLLFTNHAGVSIWRLAMEGGFAEHLPEEVRGSEFGDLCNQADFIAKLRSKGQWTLAKKILGNFPNPMLSSEQGVV
jgi:hypothetical protein